MSESLDFIKIINTGDFSNSHNQENNQGLNREKSILNFFQEKPKNYEELNKNFWELDQKCMTQEDGYTEDTEDFRRLTKQVNFLERFLKENSYISTEAKIYILDCLHLYYHHLVTPKLFSVGNKELDKNKKIQLLNNILKEDLPKAMEYYKTLFSLIIENPNIETSIDYQNLRDRWDLDIFLGTILKEVLKKDSNYIIFNQFQDGLKDWQLVMLESFAGVYPEFVKKG